MLNAQRLQSLLNKATALRWLLAITSIFCTKEVLGQNVLWFSGAVRWVATPTLSVDGRVFVSGVSASDPTQAGIFEINPANGSVTGSFTRRIPFANPGHSAALDDNGNLYFTLNGALFSVDISGFVDNWDISGRLSLTSVALGQTTPISEAQVYAGNQFNGDGLLAIHRRFGTVDWRVATASGPTAPAMSHDGRVFFGDASGTFRSVDSKTGKVLWTLDTTNAFHSAPALNRQGVVFAANVRDILAIDGITGTILWSRNHQGLWASSPVLGPNDTLYLAIDVPVSLGAGDRTGRLLALDSRSGNLKWDYRGFDQNLSVAPVVGSDNVIYVGSKQKNPNHDPQAIPQAPRHVGAINAIAGNDGGLLWRFLVPYSEEELQNGTTIPDSIQTCPGIGIDGILYVSTYKGIYALRTTSKGVATSDWPTLGGNQQRSARLDPSPSPPSSGPRWLNHPQSIDVEPGQQALFRVLAEGLPPIRFQWSKDGRTLVGQTNATLTISAASHLDAGAYRAIASDASGLRISAPAILTLKAGTRTISWGANGDGQTNIPKQAIRGLLATSAATSGNWTLALATNHTLVAWGQNDTLQTSLTPKDGGFVSIAAGTSHGLALKADGTVHGWGKSNDQTLPQATVPVGLSNVVAIAAGGVHSLALKADGTVVAWGLNGDAGFSTSGLLEVPRDLDQVVAIAASESHNVALKADGSVVVWGSEQLMGNGLQAPTNLGHIIAISAGYRFSLGLRPDGTVAVWGGPNLSLSPPGLTSVTGIAAGYNHSLATRSDGTMVAWGDSSANKIAIPSGLSTVFSISAGLAHSVSLQYESSPLHETPSLVIKDPLKDSNLHLELSAGLNMRVFIDTSGDLNTWTPVLEVLGQGHDQPIKIPVSVGSGSGPSFWKVRAP